MTLRGADKVQSITSSTLNGEAVQLPLLWVVDFHQSFRACIDRNSNDSCYYAEQPSPHDGYVTKPLGADKKRRTTTPKQVFGSAVTEKRVSHDLSQATLAAALGYSNYYLGKIERGRANITCDVMSAISSYFRMSIGQFWTFAEGLPKKTTRGR